MESKKQNYFFIVLKLLIILFIIVYMLGSTNYYETVTHDKTVLTNEAVKTFEEDVLNGEVIDLNTYIEVDTKDYTNKFTELGESLNNGVLLFVNEGFDNIANVFSYLLG